MICDQVILERIVRDDLPAEATLPAHNTTYMDSVTRRGIGPEE